MTFTYQLLINLSKVGYIFKRYEYISYSRTLHGLYVPGLGSGNWKYNQQIQLSLTWPWHTEYPTPITEKICKPILIPHCCLCWLATYLFGELINTSHSYPLGCCGWVECEVIIVSGVLTSSTDGMTNGKEHWRGQEQWRLTNPLTTQWLPSACSKYQITAIGFIEMKHLASKLYFQITLYAGEHIAYFNIRYVDQSHFARAYIIQVDANESYQN